MVVAVVLAERDEESIRNYLRRFARRGKRGAGMRSFVERVLTELAAWGRERGGGLLTLTRQDVCEYLSRMMAAPATTWRSVHRIARVLRAFYRRQAQAGVLEESPAEYLSARRNPEQFRAFLAAHLESDRICALPDPKGRYGARDSALLELYHVAALRVHEITGLRVDHLDLPGSSLTVYGERGTPRRVRLAPSTCAALDRLVGERAAYALGSSSALFVDQHSRALSKTTVGGVLKRYAARATSPAPPARPAPLAATAAAA